MSCLSPEILSLITYAELNTSKWRDHIIQEIIKYYIFNGGNTKNTECIINEFLGNLNPGFSLEDIERGFKNLENKRDIFPSSEGYVLAQAENARIAENIERARNDLERDKEIFFGLCKKYGLGSNQEKIYDHFILAFYQSLKVSGAAIFKAISEKDLRKTDWPKRFCEKFPEEMADTLISLMTEYFSNLQPSSRNRILGAMRFYLFYGASGLSNKALSMLNNGKNSKKIILLLDTNFIFSILGLHYHPQNEAVLSVMRFAQGIGKACDIRFKYIANTLEEAKEVLGNALNSLSTSQIRPNMYSPAAHAYSDIERAVLNMSADKGIKCTKLLNDYVDGLKNILEEMNITEYNVYHQLCQSDSVLHDLKNEMEYQLTKPMEKRKQEELILHDICFWHTIDIERGRTGKEFVEISIWGATIDKWLLAFDQRKRRYGEFSPPRVLFPLSLLQMLHFWIPNNREFEDCLLQSISQPFFTMEFSKDEENTTRKIVDAISHYEKAHELPEKTISAIIANQVLRSKISQSDQSESIKLVNSALIDEYNTLSTNLANLQNQFAKVEDENNRIQKEKDEIFASLNRFKISAERELNNNNERLQQAQDRINTQNQQIKDLSIDNAKLKSFKDSIFKFISGILMIAIPLGITYLCNYLFLNQIIKLPGVQDAPIRTIYNLSILTCSWLLCNALTKWLFRNNADLKGTIYFNVAASPPIIELVKFYSSSL